MARERGGRDRRDRYGGRDRSGGRDRYGGRDGRRRGIPPGRKTDYRLIVENLSSKTSWQVRDRTDNKVV